MATKSDFAQKLLHDLRLRKEKMATAQNSSGHSRQMSRDTHGNQGGTYRGAQQINALESAASSIVTSRRSSHRGGRSMNFEESTNQIVLYGNSQQSTQVRDLSMAIAFAFENSGKLSKITASSSNPLVNFFNRFGRRSMGSKKKDTTIFDNGISNSQLATVSHIHTTEISRGVQKLNEILRGYSNGLNFDKDSIEIGKKLLKGAIDLEESLRMLVNLQEDSERRNAAQQKSRIKLLDEEEEDQENAEKTAEKWQLTRPRFSFDKPSKTVQGESKNNTKGQKLALSYLDESSKQSGGRSKMVPHKRSASCIQDLNFASPVKPKNHSSPSHPTQEKGRLPNVIAKLMGLEELPEKEDATNEQKDPKGNERKQGKISRKSSKLPETLNRENINGPPFRLDKSTLINGTPQTTVIKHSLKAEKGNETPDSGSKMVKSWSDSRVQAVGTDAGTGPKEATTTAHRQQIHAIGSNQIKGPQNSQNIEKKQSVTHEKERKIIETKQIVVLNSKRPKIEDIAHDRTEIKVHANHLEKRNAEKDHKINQQKPQDQDILLQVQANKKPEKSEDKLKRQNLQKQTLHANRQKNHQVESTVPSEPKKISMAKSKKLSRDKSTPGNGKLTKPPEKLPMKDPENSRHHHESPMTENSKNISANQENPRKEDQSQISSQKIAEDNESSNEVFMQEKPTEVCVTQTKAVSRKVQQSENPRKIDVMLSRRNATANRLTRSLKQPPNILQDLKQQIHNKNHSSKKIEQQSDGEVKEGEISKNTSSVSEMSGETVKQTEKLQIEAVQVIPLTISTEDENQTQNIPETSILDDNHDDASKSGKVSDYLQQGERPFGFEDGQELMQHDKSIEGQEESTELTLPQYGYKRFPASGRQEQLTEPQKDLKEIIIKSQMFLNTAEALFKLNIPASFLHAADNNDEIADKKLILDCGYEIIKRKARIREITFHPYANPTTDCTTVSSLDDLVKQLCKDFETLNFYGGDGGNDCDIADSLHKMLNRDIHHKEPDVNTMWDFEWNRITSTFPETEDVIKEVEKHMLNGLLDEITNDLSLITVSV